MAWLASDVMLSAHQGDELLAAEMARLERVGASHARLPALTAPGVWITVPRQRPPS
jgi:hypothetical protein